LEGKKTRTEGRERERGGFCAQKKKKGAELGGDNTGVLREGFPQGPPSLDKSLSGDTRGGKRTTNVLTKKRVDVGGSGGLRGGTDDKKKKLGFVQKEIERGGHGRKKSLNIVVTKGGERDGCGSGNRKKGNEKGREGGGERGFLKKKPGSWSCKKGGEGETLEKGESLKAADGRKNQF